MVGHNVTATIKLKITKTGGLVANRFVIGDGSDYAAITSKSPGVLMFATDANAWGDVAVQGIAIVESTGTIAVGDWVMANSSDGKAVVASGTWGTNFPRGIALDAASAGEFIRVKLV